jgi:23S rRNA (pseudouridine1915-N3)-methyltransferase
MKIRIRAIGKLRDKSIQALLDEYAKRLTWQVRIDEIDPGKSAGAEKEAALLLKDIPLNAVIIALDERGQSIGSADFAQHISRWNDQSGGKEIYFLVGGADGFHAQVREKAKFLLSFGKQTWPHMLIRVMMMEQIYRAQQILSGHPYHRA